MKVTNDNIENYKNHYACLWHQKLKHNFLSVGGKLTTKT